VLQLVEREGIKPPFPAFKGPLSSEPESPFH